MKQPSTLTILGGKPSKVCKYWVIWCTGDSFSIGQPQSYKSPSQAFKYSSDFPRACGGQHLIPYRKLLNLPGLARTCEDFGASRETLVYDQGNIALCEPCADYLKAVSKDSVRHNYPVVVQHVYCSTGTLVDAGVSDAYTV
jgi:hypothetical protein